MPTDTARGLTAAAKFALRGAAGSLGFFGLLRLNWTEAHALLPFTRVQAAAAVGLFGPSALPVEVTLACSGADALALCLAAVLAYPVKWRTRLAGAGGGAALILGLNTVRIGTLGRVPAFQVGLYLALWVAAFVAAGWKRFLAGLAVLALTQAAGLLALHALTAHSGLTAHARDVRGWAVTGPLLVVAVVVNVVRARR